MQLVSNLSLAGGALILSWDFLVTNWSSQPSQIGTTAQGSVFSYTLNGVTRYRLVPTSYVANQDIFYSNWDGSSLSNPIVARG